MNIIIVSKTDAAQFFDVSVQALDGWFRRGCPIHEKDSSDRIKSLDLAAMARWRIGQISDDDLTVEKTRLTKAQANKTELEVEVLRGTLITVDRVEKIWSGLCAGAKNKMLAIPYKIAFVAQGSTDFQVLESKVRDMINEVLESIDNFKAEEYSPPIDESAEPPEKPKKSRKTNAVINKNKPG